MRIVFLFVIILITSCNKNKDAAIEYKGVVIRGTTDCSTPKGFPYIIQYTNSNNSIDSFITVIPATFNLPGTKILFKFNAIIPTDEVLTCNSNVIMPIHKSIFDIKFQ